MRLIRSSQLLALAGLFAASGAWAVSSNVSSTGDTNTPGTLRYAINQANADAAADVITIDPGVSPINLGGVLPTIIYPVTISGQGARLTIINGFAGARIFDINNASGTVLIEKLTIRGNGAGTFTGDGAGIRAQGGGTINLSQVAVESNRASGNGGGLYTTGPTTINQSTFAANSAANGGAVAVAAAASDAVTITNSTFSGNSATAVGAAFDVQTAATATIKFSTIAFNTVSVASNSIGAGLNVSGNNGGYSLVGTLLANNLTTSNDRNCGCSYSSCTFVSLGSNGVNIDTGNSCSFQSGNISNALASVGSIQSLITPALADNGGQTNTHAIPAGSPAGDYANHVDCPSVDQRGQTRPTDSDASGAAQCEVGAFETQATAAVPIGGGGGSGGGGGGSGGGGGGGGCTLAPQSSDPVIPALALIGIAGLWYRSRSKR